MLRKYYELFKPGMVYGNAVTAIAGFLLAWSVFFGKHQFNIGLFFAMLFGLSFVIASGCALNNYFDRGIDARMQRTKNRSSAKGEILGAKIIYAGVLTAIIGFGLLGLFTNVYAFFAALLGWVVYVFIYTPLKHKSKHAALAGSISGAMPPVVGYCALANRIDLGAWILFFILMFWQMPHFYAIAIHRIEDYAAAGIPVLSIKEGIYRTKLQIIMYLLALIIFFILLKTFGYTGNIYLAIMMFCTLAWLAYAFYGLKIKDVQKNKIWARRMFVVSLLVLAIFSILISGSRIFGF